jgi:DC-STAMP-like protein
VQPYVQLEVDGEGLVADMFRNLTRTLASSQHQQDDYYDDLDPSACVPDPTQPDFTLYIRIGIFITFSLAFHSKMRNSGSLLVLAWICALAEPLVLRLRPAILNAYFPERARARALWLSAHILRQRGALFRGGAPQNAQPLTRKDFLEKLKDRFDSNCDFFLICSIASHADLGWRG